MAASFFQLVMIAVFIKGLYRAGIMENYFNKIFN